MHKPNAYRAMQQQHRTRVCAEEYSWLRREEKRFHAGTRVNQRCVSTRKFYQAIAGHRNNVTPKVTCCRNKDRYLVSKQPEVLLRWAQYFDELLNDQFNKQLERSATSR